MVKVFVNTQDREHIILRVGRLSDLAILFALFSAKSFEVQRVEVGSLLDHSRIGIVVVSLLASSFLDYDRVLLAKGFLRKIEK